MIGPTAHVVPLAGQRGVALLVIFVILGLTALSLMVGSWKRSGLQQERDRISDQALAQAKAALIGRAVSIALTPAGPARPGDLPCPDMDDDGDTFGSCGSAAVITNPELRLGRLPWKTLHLPDLRDGYGERLWYAVSNSYKNNVRGLRLNSETFGTITLRDAGGTVIYDGTNPTGPSGVIAVVFSAGQPLTRSGAPTAQDRSCVVGTNCDAAFRCTTIPPTLAPKCNPVNYLDVALGEDNAGFVDSTSDGFIAGEIRDVNDTVIVNDRVAVITYADIMPVIEQRVTAEVARCLDAYAKDPTRGNGRYPWAAPLNPVSPPLYADVAGQRFGRVPDAPLIGSILLLNHASWPPNCAIDSGWWANNWKEMIFYAVADAYKPSLLGLPPAACGSCLTVLPSATADDSVVVLAAGRMLATLGQARNTSADKGTRGNYLEDQNSDTDDQFERSPANSLYNDKTFFLPNP